MNQKKFHTSLTIDCDKGFFGVFSTFILEGFFKANDCLNNR